MAMNASEQAIFRTTVDKLSQANRALGRLASRIHKQRLKMRAHRERIAALELELRKFEEPEIVKAIGVANSAYKKVMYQPAAKKVTASN